MSEAKKQLTGRVAFVTGAASGFGLAIARLFADRGAKVGCYDINGAALTRAFGHDRRFCATVGDVTDQEDVEQAKSEIVRRFGSVDIVVNNAGVTHANQPMLDVEEGVFDHVMNVNVKSIYCTTKAFLPDMLACKAGTIINIGSTAGVRPRPGLAWYNASKGAVNVLSKSMALELAPHNIRVNCIAPVMGETGLLETFMGEKDTPQARRKFEATIPLGRLSKPDDIAQAALYLASDAASFVTGTVLEIDGGRCI